MAPDDTVASVLWRRTSTLLQERTDQITADVIGCLDGAAETVEPDRAAPIAREFVRLLAAALEDGQADAHGGLILELHQLTREHQVANAELFAIAHLVERTALDELALDTSLGATSESWPEVARLVRRRTMDALAAYTDRAQPPAVESPFVDRLTTLGTRAVLDLILGKEAERATRAGYPLSLVLFDVDRLSSLNQRLGYGVGDRILERIGILLSSFFRQQDWTVRYTENALGVLLTHTDPDNVADLAERFRRMVEERLRLVDHRDGQDAVVTISAAVLNARLVAGDGIDPDRIRAEAEQALQRAKDRGGNCVERVDLASTGRGDAPR